MATPVAPSLRSQVPIHDMFRWFALVVLFGAITVSAYHRRRARARSETIPRRQEGWRLIAGRTFVGLPLFGGVAAYIAKPRLMEWASLQLPVWSRWAGVALGLLALPAVHLVLRTLGQNVSETVFTKQRHELVTRGPYRWVRHPLYTTGIAIFVALGLMTASWFTLLLALVALAAIRFVIVPIEERELGARFGVEYEQYVQRTGCMLPSAWSDR